MPEDGASLLIDRLAEKRMMPSKLLSGSSSICGVPAGVVPHSSSTHEEISQIGRKAQFFYESRSKLLESTIMMLDRRTNAILNSVLVDFAVTYTASIHGIRDFSEMVHVQVLKLLMPTKREL